MWISTQQQISGLSYTHGNTTSLGSGRATTLACGSSDPTANYSEYDSHGNMTYLGTGTKPLRMCYDSSDRNMCLVNYTSANTGAAMYYGRDVQGRLVYRESSTITAGSWALNANYWYGYTGSSDTPDFVRDANWNISEKYLQLPGG
jgi:hypothetical protein